jgi:hypothetical protein
MTTGPHNSEAFWKHVSCVKWQPITLIRIRTKKPLRVRVREGAIEPHSTNDSESHTPLRLASLPLKRSRGKNSTSLSRATNISTNYRPSSEIGEKSAPPPARVSWGLSDHIAPLYAPRSESNRIARKTVCFMFRPDVTSNDAGQWHEGTMYELRCLANRTAFCQQRWLALPYPCLLPYILDPGLSVGAMLIRPCPPPAGRYHIAHAARLRRLLIPRDHGSQKVENAWQRAYCKKKK